jgi:hypothetical protein
MKIKLVVLAVVLAALLLPGTSWAIFQFCTSCAVLGPGAGCTCPSSGPPYRFTTCNKYPAGCQLNFKSSAVAPSEKDAFLATLAVEPAASPSPAK